MNKNELLLFGERIHSVRETRKCTQEYLAEQLSISTRFYQMVERGEKSVSLPTLIRLSKVLSVSLDYLIFGDMPDDKDKNPVVELIKPLTPKQRLCAENMLKEFVRACKTQM